MQIHKFSNIFLVILAIFNPSAAKALTRIDAPAKFNESLTIKYGSNCLLEAARLYYFVPTRQNLQTIVVSHMDNLTSPADMIQDTFLNILNEDLVSQQDFHK